MIRLVDVDLALDRPILERVSISVPEGCLFGLVGPGAAGKSVLLKVLTGLMPIDQGQVQLMGMEVPNLEETELAQLRKHVGMLFQNNALFDFMTVADNVAFPLRRLFSLSEREVTERVSERLAAVGLPGFEQRMPTGLSGGQKKRVGVARATISQAPIVLYDEPVAGLDPVSSQKLFELLRAEQLERKTTVVMVSSDIDRLLTVTDRVGMMLAGKLLFEGSTEEARASENPFVRQFIHGSLEGPL